MACTRSGVAAAYLPLDPVASRSPSPWVRDASPWRRTLPRGTLRALALWGPSPARLGRWKGPVLGASAHGLLPRALPFCLRRFDPQGDAAQRTCGGRRSCTIPSSVHTHLFLAKKMARQTTTTATASYCLPTTLLLHYHYCYLLRLLLTDVPLLLSTSDFSLREVRLGALTPVRKYKYKTCIINKRAH